MATRKVRPFKDPALVAKEAAVADLLYRTVDIFRGLTGLPITLVDSPRSEVDKYKISIPFTDPHAYETLEHELAHVVFKSNGLRLRAVARDLAGSSGFENDIFLIANTLDDHRVDSLWASVYPGSGAKILAQNIASVSAREGLSVFDFVLRRSLGIEVDDYFTNIYRDVDKLVDTALRMVHLRGPIATEIAIRYLWSDEAFRRRVSDYGQSALPAVSSAPGLFAVTGETSLPFDLIPGGISGDSPEIGRLLADSEIEMKAQAAYLTNPASSPTEPVGRSSREARFVWSKPVQRVVPLSPAESLHARRIANKATRIMGRRGSELDATGSVLDIPACIDAIAGRQSVDVFRRPSATRGLNCLLLVDGSHSMEKTRRLTESACRILSEGLSSDLLNLIVCGYSSERGAVLMQDIGPKGSFPPANPKGETPTHLAIREAAEILRPFSDRRHVILVTDGEPVYTDETGLSTSTYRLMRDVDREARALQASGIGLTVLIVEHSSESNFRVISDDDLSLQFGTNWRKLDPDRVGEQLADIVSNLALQRGIVV